MRVSFRQSLFLSAAVTGSFVFFFASCTQRSFNRSEDFSAKAYPNVSKSPVQNLPNDYEDETGCEKLDILWNDKIGTSQYDTTKPLPPVENAKATAPVFRANISMDRESDELPESRPKSIHRSGSVAKVEFNAEPDSPFTGLWKGSKCGLVRLSVAIQDSKDTSTPGSAFKMFIDGNPSQNFVAMYSLDGQKNSFNFFENEFSNVIQPPRGFAVRLLAKAFERASPFPTGVFLQNIASWNQDGSRVKDEEVKFPYRIYLQPNPKFKAEFKTKANEFRNDLATIDAGTLLYTVFAVLPESIKDDKSSKMFSDISDEKYRADAVKVGTFETRSKFVASKWADEKLFFKHQRFFNETTKTPDL